MSRQTEKHQISLRLPSELSETLGRIAEALDRDRSWVIVRALRDYVEGEGADVLREAEGLAELDRGAARDFEDVLSEIDEIVSRAEARRPTTAGR